MEKKLFLIGFVEGGWGRCLSCLMAVGKEMKLEMARLKLRNRLKNQLEVWPKKNQLTVDNQTIFQSQIHST
jgi:hypothetical protein